MIYGLDRDMLYGFQIIVITVLYAFGSPWHGLVKAVSNVYFYVYAPLPDWMTETFSFSSLYPLYLASCKYIVSLLNELDPGVQERLEFGPMLLRVLF